MVNLSFIRMLACGAAFLLPLSSHAQLLDKKTLSLDAANKIVAGAIAEAKANNWSVDIAIVDEGGNLLSFQRMDGASIGAIDAAIGKARTASLYRRPTKVLEEVAKTRPAILTLPNSVLLQGGVPVVVNGQIVGAVGVGGVTSQQDEQIAEAGLRHAGLSQ
jgi:glc operon protein GlcG